MVKRADLPRHLIETALKLAAERGWAELSLAEIADAAKLPLSKVYPVFPSKAAILGAFSRQIDAAVLEAEEAGAREGSAHDRLFDALMRRFDALRPYREALGNIVCAEAGNPASALCGLSRLKRSMAGMLEAALLSTTGLRGALRIKALDAAIVAITEPSTGGVQGEDMVVVENTPETHHLVVCTLCSCYPWSVLGLPPVWYKSPPYRSRAVIDPRGVLSEFGLDIPESTAVEVHDSTAEIRYMVLPIRPAGTEKLSEAKLSDLVTRDSMIGTGQPLSPDKPA